MPFAVFRRHQRKLLAVFGILAMIAFVLDPSLFRFWNGSGGNTDPVVAKLYGKNIRRSDLYEMQVQRQNANRFMYDLIALINPTRMPPAQIFGELNTRALVDALILEHEADKLKMPKDKKVAVEWLQNRLGSVMTTELFEIALSRFNSQANRVSGETILADIASQIRIANAGQLLGTPLVTPLDVFDVYRDQTERVSVRAVAFPVEDYVTKVKDPTPTELREFYDQYKDALPDPDRDTPGFKIPRLVQVEILSIDGEALERQFRDKLTDAELRTYYENHRADYVVRSEFPADIFAKDPNASLTPPVHRPFDEVKRSVEVALGDEKAKADIANRFLKIREGVMEPFADSYNDALGEIAEDKKEGKTPTATLPKPTDLKEIAAQEGLTYDKSPLLDRERADHYGQVGDAEVGTTPFSGGKRFGEEVFQPKSTLFEPIELTDSRKNHFLVRKVQDVPPRVPSLDEIHADVTHAWKLNQARPLAEKAAQELAEKVKKEGGTIKGDTIDGRPVITTDPVPKTQMNFMTGEATPSAVLKLPHAGDTLRQAMFSLQPESVTVAPDQPKAVYYVLTLKDRFEAKFATLYAPNSEYFLYRQEALVSRMRSHGDEWMKELRTDAGLPPGWSPPGENKRESEDAE